jgi:hypothetical protein
VSPKWFINETADPSGHSQIPDLLHEIRYARNHDDTKFWIGSNEAGSEFYPVDIGQDKVDDRQIRFESFGQRDRGPAVEARTWGRGTLCRIRLRVSLTATSSSTTRILGIVA